MVKQSDLASAEKKLKDQLKQIRLARKGLPLDGSVVQTQAEVARHFKVERSTVHTWINKHDDFPCKEPPYDIAKIEAWREDRQVEDAILTGVDSPALERLRNAKADIEELKLAQLRGEVVDVEQMRESLAVMASRIFHAGELLRRRYGDDAARILNDALDEWERTIDGDSESSCHSDGWEDAAAVAGEAESSEDSAAD